MTIVPTDPKIADLLSRFLSGEPAALARAVSIVENHRKGFDQLLAALHSRTGRARRIGLTGPPGAGKSTLTAQLTAALRKRNQTVGIVAVDPTSPFSGGALLGDRIRMEEIALDSGVFIRSMATRGSLGGLAAATREVCDVIDAFGTDVILIETVGVGQSELDVARTADSTVVILVPESGDAIQTLKAGVMEIADVFVVNKADRPGADRLRRDISLMIGMRAGNSNRIDDSESVQVQSGKVSHRNNETWIPPVLESVAAEGKGVDQIVHNLDKHHEFLLASGNLRHLRRSRLRDRVKDIVEQQIRQRLWNDKDTSDWLEAQLDGLESGTSIPFSVADRLRARSTHLLVGPAFEASANSSSISSSDNIQT